MNDGFADHFSGHAGRYRRHRPTYPAALFELLARRAPARRVAWDCATGNGQAAVALAEHFERVVATDASEQQLAQARAHSRIEYRRAPAERSGLDRRSCDLVAVAQALHWFDLESFWDEVERVTAPDGLLAVWCYRLMIVAPAIDRVLETLMFETLADSWPPERALVDAGYSGIQLPFDELEVPPISMTESWSVDEALAYLSTWSAVRRFEASERLDPVAAIEPELRAVWGESRRLVEWPLVVRLARVG